MKAFRLFCQTAGFAVVLLFSTSLAHAQASRTWVSGVGDDANPCSRTAPCKTFAGAISKTAAWGEIDCLDPGGFGVVTITKAITIDCGDGDGGFSGSIVAAGSNGIVVAAGASDVVNLRNIGIQGLKGGISPGTNAIRFISGSALHIQSVMIIGFSQNGIDIQNPTYSVVTVRNSAVSDVGAAGVNVVDTGFGAVLLDTVQIANAVTGVHAGQNAKVSVLRSNIVGNTASTTVGVLADAGGADVSINLSQISFCATGISATAGTAHVSNSTVNNNVLGVSGQVGSFTPANNVFIGNAMDGTFGLTATALK